MPVNSLILGVDLAPIKPIPRTTTFQGDITSDKCRATIRQHFKTWKADTVLHDGAPNVGTAWVQDAFSQADLALQALKLATEFLVEGGTFVTKVFRSKDYNALLWVCSQLFSKVDATKPPSSRNVSAEIFVVCRGFKAPKKIDPRLLDPRSVFAELSNPTPNNEAKVFNPEVKKRKREGYEEGDYTQFREAPASEFVQTTDPIAMLGSLNRLHFARAGHEDIALAALEQLSETTPEVRLCCNDLKVLGRKEFRLLLRWRLKAREKFGLAIKKTKQDDTSGEVAQVTPMDEDAALQEELEKLDQNESARKKREKRRTFEKRQKEIMRMQMNMLPPTEIGLEQSGPNGEDSMFTLGALDPSRAIDITKGNMGIVLQKTPHRESNSESVSGSDEEQDGLDSELDTLYNEYQQRRSETDAKYRAKKARKEHEELDWNGIAESVASSDDDVEMDRLSTSTQTSEDDESTSQLPASSNKHSALTHRAALFFDQDVFKDVGLLDQVDPADSGSHGNEEKRGSDPSKKLKRTSSPTNGVKGSDDLQDVVNTTSSKSPNAHDGMKTDKWSLDRRAKVESRKESDDLAVQSSIRENNEDREDQYEPQKDGRLDIDIITAEAMTLARQVATGTRTTRDLVDDTFNKYAFLDRDGLPDWFLDDEGKHSQPHRPIDAAAAKAIKEKIRALNVRPIKKVREAKERKKFKAAQRLEKLRKKSTLLADDDGLSEKDKAQNIASLMSKAAKKKPKKEVKLVVARGGNRGISGRPKGVKGKYKIVDARLKKDTRAEKRLAKKKR
ncbi:MAG: hypothetical protein Q9221_002760 [Calogaya cf. arnoldii]